MKFTTIPELIEAYKERFLPHRAEGVDGVVQLVLTGEGACSYYLIIKDQTLTPVEGVHADPTVTVTSSVDNWLKMNNGEANPMTMLMMGKIKVSGSLPLATKFQTMFNTD